MSDRYAMDELLGELPGKWEPYDDPVLGKGYSRTFANSRYIVWYWPDMQRWGWKVSGSGPRSRSVTDRLIYRLWTTAWVAMGDIDTAIENQMLESIPGIGPSRRDALREHLRSADAIMEATVWELMRVPGISRMLAQRIRHWLDRARDSHWGAW